MTDTRMANTLWARAFMDELARAGVREICVAPGSRSTPLVLAAAADGRFRMFPILDERSAGFFALGIGKASQWPAAVITTSGTATANLYPAVIEASQGEVPILLLSADRPHRLRDTDGNQAIDQVRLFGTFPRAFFEVELPRLDEPALRHLRALAGRAVALALGPPRGPVHLNFPFEKPLEPPGVPGGGVAAFGREGANPHTRVAPVSLEPSEEAMARLAGALASARRGLIVAGPVPDAGRVAAAVLALGEATGFPVLADPLSGARFSPSHGARVVAGYDLFLRSPEARRALAPDLVLRVGGSPTSSALLAALEEWGGATQVVVDDGHRWKDHPATAHGYVRASPRRLLERLAGEADRTADDGWIRMWGEVEARTREVVERRGPGELLEGEILASVVEGLPEGANLLVASSMPIRDLDAFGVPGDELLNVFGNRGASGIDGLVSTTLGIAVGAGGMAGTGGTAGLEGATMGEVKVYQDITYHQGRRRGAHRLQPPRGPERLSAGDPAGAPGRLQGRRREPGDRGGPPHRQRPRRRRQVRLLLRGDQRVRGDEGYVGGDGLPRLNVLELQRYIRSMPKPVIALVAGTPSAGGHVLHVICDLTIAADNAVFGQTGPQGGELRRGLRRLLPGQHRGAEEGPRDLVPVPAVRRPGGPRHGAREQGGAGGGAGGEGWAWAREIMEKSPLSIRLLKSSFNAAVDGQAGMQELAGNATLLFYMTEQAQEAKRAYLEKRKPDFRKYPWLPW
jgi:2-succinyl-5-enolpyruvyl-6-hydroxy-3-cyclohexene-1-carboxylate synthase